MDNIAQNENNVKQEINVSRLAYQLNARLVELKNRFKNHPDKPKEADLFQTNDQLTKWLHCTEPGLMKARKQIIKADWIKHQPRSVKGKASFYWILPSNPLLDRQEPLPVQGKTPLTPARAKQFIDMYGEQGGMSRLRDTGYTEAEVIRALGEPK